MAWNAQVLSASSPSSIECGGENKDVRCAEGGPFEESR
jgi:hypothetical protein